MRVQTFSVVAALGAWLDARAARILTLMHGAVVYDLAGQNICLTDCLTLAPETSDIRTLIYFADGKIAYDWQYPAARFL